MDDVALVRGSRREAGHPDRPRLGRARGVDRGLAAPATSFAGARHERAVLGARTDCAARTIRSASVRRTRCIARSPAPDQDFYQVYFSALGPVIEEIESDLRGWVRDLTWTVSGEALAAAGLVLGRDSRSS